MTVEVLDPTLGPTIVSRVAAPRLASTDGTVVGLYSNEKLNATALLDRVGTLLVEEHGVAAAVRGTYAISHLMPEDAWVRPDDCHFIVLSNGD